jgi:signal transduction histidine kinase
MNYVDFKLLFESAPGLFLVLLPDSPEFTIVGASDAYLVATMTTRENVIGRGLFEVFPDNPDDLQATGTSNLRASLERVLANGTPDTMAVQKYDIRRPESEGGGFEERHWSPINSPVLADGELRYILHRVEDVTEFVRAAKQQQEQSAAMNQRMKSMETEILARSRELDDARRQLARKVEIGERNLASAEEQLAHAQKMEAVGRLAGGIAHDFNNLLSVIIGYAQFAQENLQPDSQLASDIEEIRQAGERAAGLTRQLLAFSRKQVLQPAVLNINEAVERMDKMLRRLLGEDVQFRTRLADNLDKVRADPGQLEQVIVNLAINARDAMPDGGKLTIETGNASLDKHYVEEHPEARTGPHVFIALSDTGFGMDAATREKIFEPFFTTKEMGRGTGLGLSTVYGIIKQSGGNIWVYSEPGRGTTFKVYLPRVESEVDAGEPALPEFVKGGSETILVLEDEPGVRRLAVQVLEKAGYTVRAAENGDRAIELFGTDSDVALLLTDVVLPGTGGPALAKQLQAINPRLKVLFMSGYTDNAIVHHGVLDAGVNFIEKPIRPDALLKKVRNILDA